MNKKALLLGLFVLGTMFASTLASAYYCGINGVWNGTAGSCDTDNTYAKADFQEIVVDSLGYAGASFVSWVDLIVLLIVLGFIVGIFIKLGNLFR